uniref:hypothetical protein n=1 Tax=Synechococcus sp. UW106 TaxID=368495 RepID=UPI000E0FD780|nr:hypothetical protein [Synechococcus sp. UW106]
MDTIVPEMQRVLFLTQRTIVGDGNPREMLRPTALSELFQTPLNVVEPMGFARSFPGSPKSSTLLC